MYSMLEDSPGLMKSKKFKKLTSAICGLVSSFPFDLFYFRSSEESSSATDLFGNIGLLRFLLSQLYGDS